MVHATKPGSRRKVVLAWAVKPNRLIHEQSPYLRQHAQNPVDWFPWGDEAFAKARAGQKPIFLSIGYSACHWCHVMERESFENEEVASLLNTGFVAIKVDREERPDIDRLYMTAVQATTGRGGWPMSVWLTPDREPFYCGTYFPPDSFRQLLERIRGVWEANHVGVVAQARQLTEVLTAQLTGQATDEPPARPLDDAPLRLGFDQLRDAYDTEHGGFGSSPKFPHTVALNFLFRHFVRTGDTSARDMALHQLRAMACGGLFDQLGGGFHRYSVDERWLVSHFEKMLYDQALLISSYIDAWQITGDPFHADIARRTADYVLCDLTSPDGAFYCAEDADSEGVEGKFYVWTRAEIEQVLRGSGVPAATGPHAFCQAYGVTAAGNWEQGNNILHLSSATVAAEFAAERAALLAMRKKRVRPARDEKVLTAWNGLMISALARAAQLLPEGGRGLPAATGLPLPSSFHQAAARAARCLLAHHYREGRLWRTPTVPAMLDDYANFATGLVDLYETDFDPSWLRKAGDLTDQMLAEFGDTGRGGFYQTDGRDSSVLIRSKDDYDGAEPSGNSMATLLLLRLAALTGQELYRVAGERTLAAFAGRLESQPTALPQMLCALDWALNGPVEITISGRVDAADTRTLREVVNERYLPNRVLRGQPADGPASAQVCRKRVCQVPVTDPSELGQLLDG